MRLTRNVLLALLALPLTANWEAAAAQTQYRGPGSTSDTVPRGCSRSRAASPVPWAGPGDVVGGARAGDADAGTGTPTGDGSDSVPFGGGATSIPAPSGTELAARASHEVGPETWWTWWELHKLDYLRPNLIRNWVATVSGYSGGDGFPARALELVRQELWPTLMRDLRDGDPDVRAGAALAVGRMGGDDAVAPLLATLDDGSIFVRERAMLSLGATGSSRAAAALLAIARTGALVERGERVCPDARMIAILALGVGRCNGFDPAIDAEVAQLGADIPRAQRTAVQTALACYQTLVPNPALVGWCYERAGDEKLADPARSRALEALRYQGDDAALERLLEALGGRRLESRRSAALALGELDHEDAAGHLIAASHTEKEPLADSFVLVSIGRQGGDEAKSFLLEELQSGPKTQRAWCALALGMLARDEDDPEIRDVLRRRVRTERNDAMRGAWYLALGMARDEEALPLLQEALIEGFMPETRAAAAFGLAMIGTKEARGSLLDRLFVDPSPVTRAQIAQSIGFLGDARDADALLRTLREQPGPEYLSTVALSLGLHGSRAALEGLVAVVKDDYVSPPARAAALEAVQLLVGRGPSLTLADLLRQTNYAVFPPPLVRHMDMPL